MDTEPPDPGGRPLSPISDIDIDIDNVSESQCVNNTYYKMEGDKIHWVNDTTHISAINSVNISEINEENINYNENKETNSDNLTSVGAESVNKKLKTGIISVANSEQSSEISNVNNGIKTSWYNMWLKDKDTAIVGENIKEIKFYLETDEGPFIIHAESKDKNIGRLHPMAVGRIFHRNLINISKDIENISAIGKNKIKITFNNYKSANRVIRENLLDIFNIKAFIPRYKLVRTGIIFDIDPDLEEEEIFNCIRCDSEVISIKCLKSKNNESMKPNSQRVKILFRGNMLPERVFIHSVSCRVMPYIQRLIQCHKCWRFGHIKIQCRSKERCKKCADEHNINACKNDEETCCLCYENHQADSKICEVYLKNKKIKEIMAMQNSSYEETKKIIQNNGYAKAVSTYNQYKSYQNNFPGLNSNMRSSSDKPNANKYEILANLIEKEQVYDTDNLMRMNKPTNISSRNDRRNYYKANYEYRRGERRVDRTDVIKSHKRSQSNEDKEISAARRTQLRSDIKNIIKKLEDKRYGIDISKEINMSNIKIRLEMIIESLGIVSSQVENTIGVGSKENEKKDISDNNYS